MKRKFDFYHTLLLELRARWYRWLAARAERRQLAEQLHRSGAWHCGCVPCREHARDGKVFGRVETIKLTDEERAKLRGEKL